MQKRVRNQLQALSPPFKKALMVGMDALIVVFSFWAALSLRIGDLYDGLGHAFIVLSTLVLATILIFSGLGFYRMVMRYIGWRVAERLTLGVVASSLVLLVIMLVAPEAGIPRSSFVIYALVLFTLVAGSRILARKFFSMTERMPARQRVALYGAGTTGRLLLHMLGRAGKYHPVVFLDDNAALHGREVNNLRVLDAGSDELVEQLQLLEVETILLAIPSARPSQRRKILARIEPMPFHVLTVPCMQEIISGAAKLDDVREVDVEDLLGREPVSPNAELLRKCIHAKTVLVTGAGGSIGSEICRQVIEDGASRLILVDISEFSLYQIDKELRAFHRVVEGAVEVVPVLGCVTDAQRIADLFGAFSIDTVYHAAAYKHVPLVEHNPIEGLQNNTFGTFHVAEQAARAGVKHFVLISTDKAVRPTNIMGASKRLAEMSLQALQQDFEGTIFSMVRFGNVLGSSGSVVPLFHEQIRSGQGYVTVTHPEITRYFMTIPEAVQLVIQAGAMARGGEVFVLDMGEPVRIVDLARRMIRLSGLEVRDAEHPDGDIELRFSGLRPGEKLYEELLIGDGARGTDHPKIMCADEHYPPMAVLEGALQALRASMDARDMGAIREHLVGLVKGYAPHEQVEDWVWQALQRRQGGNVGQGS